VLISGKDVSAAIRTEQITALTRHAAGSALVRGVLVQLQRKIGRELGGFVTEGRDQGSVVFPDADVKFYLDASAEIRARRRTDELQSAGADADYDDILQSIIDRDQRDIARQVGPLVRPDGAIVIDTSDMDINQVTDAMIQAVEERT
ncbi:MAG: (d)CMP kinase, partial [Phycisphaerae bacterium]|jgi:cytidylate kinase|nr:(d)CMP kinase [Phycisphaerae bacterium]